MVASHPKGWFDYHPVKIVAYPADPSLMKIRMLAATAIVVTLGFANAGPSLAKSGGQGHPEKSAERAHPGKAHRAEAQARRKARFVAVGTVTDVSAGSITLLVKGGSARELRGKSQAFVISGADISRNGQPGPAVKGDHAMVKGVRTGENPVTYTATKVRAESGDHDAEATTPVP